MDWFTGLGTIVAMELIARKSWYGWLVGLCNQVFWVWLIWDRKLWGLVPLTSILIWRYTVFLVRWRSEHLQTQRV